MTTTCAKHHNVAMSPKSSAREREIEKEEGEKEGGTSLWYSFCGLECFVCASVCFGKATLLLGVGILEARNVVPKIDHAAPLESTANAQKVVVNNQKIKKK